MLQEFKKFAMRGNVMDMAIGLILGAAFATIVKSAVADVVMPPIGMLLGGVDFSDLAITLQDAVMKGEEVATPAVELRYGLFLNAVINFLIIAFVIFMVVRTMNKLKGEEPKPEPTEKNCDHCCTTIAIKATKCPNCTADLAAA